MSEQTCARTGICCLPEYCCNRNCKGWTERTDSVEKIALDMLANLHGIRTTVCIDATKLDVPTMDRNYAKFADRLREHGIEVPE